MKLVYSIGSRWQHIGRASTSTVIRDTQKRRGLKLRREVQKRQAFRTQGAK
ncbi:hypothetical protein HanIR_Chr13g0652091 [Helianthus annuus]|nr:hypothetical protein HanIR_Chr13g0652091 [Helianthus annuus]